MPRNLGKKAWLVALATTALVAIFVATALAAPVLQPGTTSYPGMSGTCTNCHTYATPAPAPAPAPTPGVTPPTVKPPIVSSGGENDEGDRPVVKRAVHKKHHSRRHHRSVARREKD